MKIEKPSHTGLLFGAEKKYFINKKYLPRAMKIVTYKSNGYLYQ